jgi:hypothetical protein
MPTPTISESARSIGNSVNTLFGLVKPIRKAVLGIIDPETAYANQWYNQGTTDRQYSRPIGPTRDIYEQPGVGYFDRGSGRFLGPGSATTIRGADIGGDGRGEQYRQQLSQYAPKAFPMTAEGQQERYFGTPEMNYVFGAQTGKGPKTAEEMSALATQAEAPATSSLSDYYRAQSAMGRVNQADIQKMYAGQPDLQKWAAANQMLAMREYNKKFPAGEATQGPSDDAIRAAISGGKFYPSEGSPSPITNPPDFGTPANVVPAPWNTQGQAVSAPYAEANQRAAEKTSDGGMPALNTTAGQPSTWDKTAKFLNEITPFMRTLVGPGGLGNYGIR